MTTEQIYLPVDVTGISPDNLFVNELHEIHGGYQGFIRPNAGSFFKNSFQIYTVDGNGNQGLLVKDTDYELCMLDVQATKYCGEEIYNMVLILNPNLTSIFSITYQAYGGSDNPNVAQLYAAYFSAGRGFPVWYQSLTNKPTGFTPQAHIHDIADVYGLEYAATAIADIANAVAARNTSSNDIEITDKLRQFRNAIYLSAKEMIDGSRQHIDNSGHLHVTNAATLGFGNLQNIGFAPIAQGLGFLPYYASPKTLTDAIATPPAATTSTHSSQTNNPHNDNVAHISGINNLLNYSLAKNYVANSYTTLFSTLSQTQYLSAYSSKNAVIDWATSDLAAQYSTPIENAIADKTTQLNAITNSIQNTMTAKNDTATQVTNLQQGITAVTETALEAAQAIDRFNIVNDNMLYSATLVELLGLEYQNYGVGSGITEDGFFRIPEYIPNLVSWLSVNNPKNTLFPSPQGDVRLTKLVDYIGSREFSAQPNTAPIFKPSSDVSEEKQGITQGNVASFTPGHFLELTKGVPILLKRGMTYISVYKTGPHATEFTLLSDPFATAPVGIKLNTSSNRAVDMKSTLSWIPMRCAENTIQSDTSAIAVCSLAPTDPNNDWFASSNAIDHLLYPKGADTPVSTQPSNSFTGDPLSLIGNENAEVQNYGEFAELLVYDRQLSGAEVKSIVAYLKLRYSLNTALSVDFSALNAF